MFFKAAPSGISQNILFHGDVIPRGGVIFGSCIFGAKSTLLGSQSVDSLAPWGVQTEPLFNKDCLQSFPGSLGPPSTRLYQFTVL